MKMEPEPYEDIDFVDTEGVCGMDGCTCPIDLDNCAKVTIAEGIDLLVCDECAARPLVAEFLSAIRIHAFPHGDGWALYITGPEDLLKSVHHFYPPDSRRTMHPFHHEWATPATHLKLEVKEVTDE